MKPFYKSDGITIYNDDCLDRMAKLDSDSIDLICIDPPYNIGKAEWDKWNSVESYVEFMGLVFAECERLLKDNGSFYFFHNDFLQIVELQNWLNKNSKFVFKQLIIWDKYRGTPQSHPYKGAMWKQVNSGGKRCYSSAKDYCLFYTFQDKTGLTTVMLDTNNFSSLRQYFKEYQEAIGLNKKQILNKIGQKADHCFRWSSSQWDMPTRETYQELERAFSTNGFLRLEYEDLRLEYEDLRYTFNQSECNLSILHFPIPDKNERVKHPTQKSVALIDHIVKVSSNEGDLILDCFMGSGATLKAAKNLNRRVIGIDSNREYCEIAAKGLEGYTAKETKNKVDVINKVLF